MQLVKLSRIHKDLSGQIPSTIWQHWTNIKDDPTETKGRKFWNSKAIQNNSLPFKELFSVNSRSRLGVVSESFPGFFESNMSGREDGSPLRTDNSLSLKMSQSSMEQLYRRTEMLQISQQLHATQDNIVPHKKPCKYHVNMSW